MPTPLPLVTLPMPWSMLDPVAFLKIAVRVALDPALMVAGLAMRLTIVGTVATGTSGVPAEVSMAAKLSAGVSSGGELSTTDLSAGMSAAGVSSGRTASNGTSMVGAGTSTGGASAPTSTPVAVSAGLSPSPESKSNPPASLALTVSTAASSP